MPTNQPIDIIYTHQHPESTNAFAKTPDALTILVNLLGWGGIALLFVQLIDHINYAIALGLFLPLITIMAFVSSHLSHTEKRRKRAVRTATVDAAASASAFTDFLLALFNSDNPNTTEYLEFAAREIPNHADRFEGWGTTIRLATSDLPQPQSRAEHFQPIALRDANPDLSLRQFRRIVSQRRLALLLEWAVPVTCVLFLVIQLTTATPTLRLAAQMAFFPLLVLATLLPHLGFPRRTRSNDRGGLTRTLEHPEADRQSRFSRWYRPNFADYFGNWWLVPAGVVYRVPRQLDSELHLFPRPDCVLVATRIHGKRDLLPWRLIITRRDGFRLVGQFSDNEANTLLNAWLSPQDPPTPDQLTDLK